MESKRPNGTKWIGRCRHADERSLAKHWVFTAWDEPDITDDLPDWATFISFGREVCPDTRRVHWQGYVELAKKARVGPIRKLFSDVGVTSIWLAMRLGNPCQARDYTMKDGDYVELGELSSDASHQGQRTDIQRIIDAVDDRTLTSVVGGCRSGLIQNWQQLRIVDRLIASCEPVRAWRPDIVVHWGPSGTGKSRLAEHLFPNAYRAPACTPRWWPKYDGHDAVIVNEFRGSWLPFHELLAFTDRYEYQLEYKGGHRQLIAHTMVFTTPLHPRDWYPNCREQLAQLLRRISVIRYFFAEVDERSDVSDIKYTETTGLALPLTRPFVPLQRLDSSNLVVPDLDPEVGVGNIALLAPRADNVGTYPDFADVLADLGL